MGSPWEKRKFSEVFELLKNNTLSRAELTSTGYGLNIHYGDVLIRFSEVLDLRKNYTDSLSKDIVEKFISSQLTNGDVVIADTAEDSTVGKACEVIGIEKKPVISGLHTIPIHPKITFAPGFLGYLMNSNFIHNQLKPLMQGIKVTSISRNSLLSLDICFPATQEEQKKIAQVFSSLSSYIELHQYQLELLKEQKRGLLQRMFPKEGNNVPELRFPEFTAPWEQRKLGELAPLRGGFAFKSENYIKDGIPIIRISNILSDGSIGSNFTYYSEQNDDDSYLLKNGAILIAMSGATTGKVAILKCPNEYKYYQNQRVGYFIPISSCDYKFISIIVQSQSFKDQLNSILVSGTQPNVSAKDIDSFKFSIPMNRKEQEQIGSFFSNLDHFITLHQRKLDLLKEQKKGLLQKMFPKEGEDAPKVRFPDNEKIVTVNGTHIPEYV